MKKEISFDPDATLFAREHGGSRAMYIYLNMPDPGLDKNSFFAADYILASREDEKLWTSGFSCIFRNKEDDVRILRVEGEKVRQD